MLMLMTLTTAAAADTAETAAETVPTRAVWLTTVGGLDWPRTYATDAATRRRQQRELTEMLDTLKRIGINTVLLQTRVRATVIYPSALEPWDAAMSGTAGTSPGYDPLAFAVDECHKRGMQLHAWVVAIPAGKWNSYGCRRLRNRYPSLVKKIDDTGYLNPEQPQTGDVIAAVCGEIVSNYDVDGIHLDYIRYPETWKIRVTGDRARACITSIVRKVNQAVRDAERRRPAVGRLTERVEISCSPIGKYRDLARYSSHGWNAYGKGQDAEAWLRGGLVDRLYPMMYFKGDGFYPFAIDWSERSHGKEIVCGLGIYFLDRRHGDWDISEIKRQMYVARSLGMGVCFFRARFLYDNTQGIYDFLRYEYDYAPLVANAYDRHDTAAPGDGRPSDDCLRLTLPPGDPATSSMPVFAYDRRTRTVDMSTVMTSADGTLRSMTTEMDVRYVFFESMQGRIIAVRPYRRTVDVSDIPDGTYFLRAVNRKRRTHRVGCTVIRRNEE